MKLSSTLFKKKKKKEKKITKNEMLDVCQLLPSFPPFYMCFLRSTFETQQMQGLLPLKIGAGNCTIVKLFFLGSSVQF